AAISTLTGIQPLENLAAHAGRVKAKLTTDLVRDRQGEIALLDEQYHRIRGELTALFEEHPDIKPSVVVPSASSNQDIEETLEKAKDELEGRQASAFSDAKTILGATFDPSSAEQRRDLRDNISLAVASIELHTLATLPSGLRLANLRAIKPEDIEQA